MIGNEKRTLYNNVEQKRLWGKQNKPPSKANLHSKKKGIVDVIVTSIERFVDRNVNKGELYKSKEFLPDLAKKLLVRKVILENDDLFEIFRKVKNNTNFIDRMCSYIDSAKNQNLCAEDILNKYTEEDFLGKKLSEFSNI